MREIKLRMQSCRRRGVSRERHTRSVAIGGRGVIIMWGVTAGKASHNTSKLLGLSLRARWDATLVEIMSERFIVTDSSAT